jgi:hypothetical protein
VETMNPVPRLDALHYLFTQKQDRCVAHCLDLDLVAVAQDRATAEYRLNAIVRAQISGAYSIGNYGLLFFHAPTEYWAVMKQGQDLPKSLLKIETTPPMFLPIEQKLIQVELPVFRTQAAQAA